MDARHMNRPGPLSNVTLGQSAFRQHLHLLQFFLPEMLLDRMIVTELKIHAALQTGAFALTYLKVWNDFPWE